MKMIKALTNKQIRRELDFGEVSKFAKHIPMTVDGCSQRLKRTATKQNLCYAYAIFRAENPRDE